MDQACYSIHSVRNETTFYDFEIPILKQPKKFTALVVEDDPFSQRKFRTFLKRHFTNLDIGYADSYDSGLGRLGSKTLPNLAIVDVFLNGNKSGLDLIYKMTELVFSPSIILTSAMELNTFKHLIPRELQTICFLHKPFQLEDFQSALKRLHLLY